MTTTLLEDLRPLLFEDAPWYAGLQEDSDDLWVAWRVTKSTEPAWWRELLIAAAAFARDHGVLPSYRKRFAGIPRRAITDSAGNAENRSSSAPIWEIANELVVGSYLERALNWRVEENEPSGHRGAVGDWLFTSPTGRSVFVEVKSLVEPELYGRGVFSRGIASDRLTAVLRGAYRQLPRDHRYNLVVVVGTGLVLSLPHDIIHGDLFQTLYGRIEIRFSVMPYIPGSERMGPSFRDMFAHAGKHRRLGCVAGLQVAGLSTPGLGFYAIHNPFAAETAAMTPADFPDVRQYWVDADGLEAEIPGVHPDVQWERIAGFAAAESE